MTRIVAIYVTAGLALSAVPARALEVGGHEIPEATEVAGKRLTLNGAGIRRKFVFRVYVCALYLEERSSDPRRILAGDRPWQLTIHFMRNVGHHQLLEAFTDAFEHNNPAAELQELRDDLERFHAVLQDLKKGDDVRMEYVPGIGTKLHAPDGAVAVVAGKRFANALLRMWIGDHPSDDGLKAQLLGL